MPFEERGRWDHPAINGRKSNGCRQVPNAFRNNRRYRIIGGSRYRFGDAGQQGKMSCVEHRQGVKVLRLPFRTCTAEDEDLLVLRRAASDESQGGVQNREIRPHHHLG